MIKKTVHSLGILVLSLQLLLVAAQDTNWQTMIESWRTEYNVPGMSVGIIRDGEIIFSDGFGVLEEGGSQKVDKHTLFAIASNTKAFISASIAALVGEGKMNWDDNVRQYLHYFELYDPCVSEMMTVRDLLCHRSGLGTFSGDVVWYRSNYSAEEVVRRAAEIPQQFEFRSGFGYSNIMFIAAGEVIHAVTGKTWAEYLKKRFLEPLEMSRTIISTRDIPSVFNVATPHKPEGESNHPIDWVTWDNSGAAAGIISSADDMLKWIRVQLNSGMAGADTFFTKGQQMTMWTPHVHHIVSDRARELFGGRNFNGYGLGWGTSEYFGRQLISHTGGYDGMYSAVMMLPSEKIGVVVLTNSMKGISTVLCYEIFDKLLGLPQKDWKQRGINQDKASQADRAARIKKITDARISGTSPDMPASMISGLYRCPMYGDIMIREEAGQLLLDFVAAPQLKAILSHWHHDTYAIEWIQEQAWFGFGTVQIQMDNNAKPSRLLFEVPNDDIFFEEINAVRITP